MLGLCIVLAIVFTVGFNIISRISLSTTRKEDKHRILKIVAAGLATLGVVLVQL